MQKSLMKRVKYAKKIVREGLKSPFLRLVSSQTEKGISTKFMDGNKKVSLSKKSGYYTIYRMYRKNLQCLYVGKTDTDLYMRINRWSRGVDGSLRPDENHAAATKARRDGIKLTDKIGRAHV